jgi:hypothetical protein
MAAERQISRTLTGASYPTDYLAAVIDDLQEAETAVIALQEAGFLAKHIVLITNDQAASIIQEYAHHHSFLQSIKMIIAVVASDEGEYPLFYAHQVRQGRHILYVYAPRYHLVECAQAILKTHHAHMMKFFGRWTITHLW